MQLQFVPVEEFYFALTLDTRLLLEWTDAQLVGQVQPALKAQYGQSSTVAAAKQNSFNYVFRIVAEDIPPDTILEVFDWAEQLRLSSNYGLVRAQDGKVTRLTSYEQRPQLARQVSAHLSSVLAVELP